MKLALGLPGNYTITPPAQIGAITSKTTAFGGNIIAVAIGTAFAIGSIIALFFVVYGGIKWITSGGDPKDLEDAREMIIYAAVGLAVMFFSYGIVIGLGIFFGVPLIPSH